MESVQQEGRFLHAIFLSLAFHALLVSCIVIGEFIGWPSLRVNMDVTHVSLVNLPPPKKGKVSAALPKATVQEIKSLPQKQTETKAMPEIKKVEPKKPETKKPVEPKPKAQEKINTKGVDSEITRIQKELELEKQIAAIAAEHQDAKPGETTTNPEEMGVPNGSEDGTSLVSGYELAQYQDIVRAKVLSSWHLPPWTADSLPPDTHAIIVVYISEDGGLIRTEVEKSSNHNVFDQSALRAIRRAAPLPSPPEDLAREARRKGIVMKFSPKKE